MSRRFHYLLRLFLICVCGMMLVPLVCSVRSARAATDPIAVTSETETVHFPQYIDFALSAQDTSSPISQAILYITYEERAYPPSIEHQITINNPAQTITLHYHEDTGGSNFHAPGTPVEYHWALEDDAANWHTEEIRSFTTSDTRFSWQHLSQGFLHVNWYNRPQSFGQLLLNKADASIGHISAMLGNGLRHPINVWAYASNDDFHGALAPGSYEWVGGEAHPWLNEAFISVQDSNDDTLVRDMPHELTHLVFHQLIAQGPIPPTWFDEGIAVYNQFYHEPEMKFRFDQALSNHSLLRLDSLTDSFPADSDKAYLAYAQSWQLIAYMYSTFGQPKMSQLIQDMNDPANIFDRDLLQAIGEDQLHLENQWHLSLHQPPVLFAAEMTPTAQPVVKTSPSSALPIDNTTPLLLTLGILMVVFPLIGLMGIFVYRRRRQQQSQTAQGAQQILTAQSFAGQENNGTRHTTYPITGEQEDDYSLPFMPFQESSGTQMGKHAPQE